MHVYAHKKCGKKRVMPRLLCGGVDMFIYFCDFRNNQSIICSK